MDQRASQRFLSGLVSRDNRMVALLKLDELFGVDMAAELSM
jgi:hypothetical protein